MFPTEAINEKRRLLYVDLARATLALIIFVLLFLEVSTAKLVVKSGALLFGLNWVVFYWYGLQKGQGDGPGKDLAIDLGFRSVAVTLLHAYLGVIALIGLAVLMLWAFPEQLPQPMPSIGAAVLAIIWLKSPGFIFHSPATVIVVAVTGGLWLALTRFSLLPWWLFVCIGIVVAAAAVLEFFADRARLSEEAAGRPREEEQHDRGDDSGWSTFGDTSSGSGKQAEEDDGWQTFNTDGANGQSAGLDPELREYANYFGLRLDTLTRASLKAAYHKRAKTAHPDRGGSDIEFKELTRRYDALTVYMEKR